MLPRQVPKGTKLSRKAIRGAFHGLAWPKDTKCLGLSDAIYSTQIISGMEYLIAADEGTGSARCLLFSTDGRLIDLKRVPIETRHPGPDRVEQDALALFQAQHRALEALLEAHPEAQGRILGLGITNQRETCLLWDKSNGKPLGPALVWQDRRSRAWNQHWVDQGLGDEIKDITGLTPDAYFSAGKLCWMLENYPDAKPLLNRGLLAFGTIDSWLLWKWTGGKVHKTDTSNASRTLLMDLKHRAWSPKLLQLFGIPESILPEIQANHIPFGHMELPLGFGKIPIGSLLGDQQAALLGQGCIEAGQTKNTYGTGCFLMQQTGEHLVQSTHGLLSTLAWETAKGPCYALEGSIFHAGSLLQWLKEGLGLFSSIEEREALAAAAVPRPESMLLPAFGGLGAPWWTQGLSAQWWGIPLDDPKPALVRAAYEAIAHQVCDVLEALKQDSGHRIDCLQVDGGLSQSPLLMQWQADLSGTAVSVQQNPEATARGAFYMCGIALGLWTLDCLPKQDAPGRQYVPQKVEGLSRRDWVAGVKDAIEHK